MENLSRREFLLAAAAGTAAFLAGNIGHESSGTQDRVREVLDDLEVRDSDYPKAIEQARQSVFKISGPNGHGSGVLLANGIILTNNHVCEANEHRIEPRNPPGPSPLPLHPAFPPLHNIAAINDANWEAQAFSDDDRRPGERFRVAPVQLADGTRARHKDLQLLRLPPNAPRIPMRPVSIGEPRLGQPTLHIGSPMDFQGHVGHGRVARTVLMNDEGWGNDQWAHVPFVNSDGPVNAGSSGGALFSLRKVRGQDGKPELRVELIGVPTFGTRNAQGLGGCIRADFVAFIASTKWGIPLMTPQQIEEYRRQFPTAQ